MFAQIGDIRFEIKVSPTAINRSASAVYAEHELIDRKSRLQRTGRELEKVDINIVFDASFCSPAKEVLKLKNYRDGGDVLYFIWGNGDVEGRFVIVSVDENITNSAPDGTILRVEAFLSLTEYDVKDEKIPERQLGIDNAKAINKDGLIKSEIERIGKLDVRTELAKDYKNIINGGAGINQVVADNNGVLGAVQKKNILTSMNEIKESATSFKEKADRAANSYNETVNSVNAYVNDYVRDLVSNVNGVAVSANSILSSTDLLKNSINGPSDTILGANKNLNDTITNFKNTYSGLRKYNILRK